MLSDSGYTVTSMFICFCRFILFSVQILIIACLYCNVEGSSVVRQQPKLAKGNNTSQCDSPLCYRYNCNAGATQFSARENTLIGKEDQDVGQHNRLFNEGGDR